MADVQPTESKVCSLRGYGGLAADLLLSRLLKRRRPLSAILCVTNRCNLRCWYCYGEHAYRRECREFTTDELLDLIRSLRRMGMRMLQIQGGEPLLRKDITEVLREAQRLGVVRDMVTNGILVPARDDVLALLNKICISLDGPESATDRNRGTGTFKKAIAGIRYAVDAGLPVRLSAVITAETARRDIDWLIAFSSEQNISVNFSPSFDFRPRYRRDDFGPHAVPDDRLRMLLRYIARQRHRGAPVQFAARAYELAASWPFSYEVRRAMGEEHGTTDLAYPACRHGDYVVFIDSDGSVYPCCNFWGESAPNLHRDGIADAFEKLSRQGCRACHIPAYIERNRFLDGQPRVWWNYAIQSLRNIRK